jgi:hypothetical protein
MAARPVSAPLSDAVIIAMARLVDDARDQRREPSHSAIGFQFERAGLKAADYTTPTGKEKRVRAVLSHALEYAPEDGSKLVGYLLAVIKGSGGFRRESPNFVGSENLANTQAAFAAEGFVLSSDGELSRQLLETLAGVEVTEALQQYVRRALAGSEDDALVVGTGKDLVEATAAHVLVERWGNYSTSDNFPTLLGQAFVALDLATPQTTQSANERPQRALERSIYALGCAVNRLRNKSGTGHGRPFLPSLSEAEARAAIESMGLVAHFLLDAHKMKPR